MEDEPNEPIWIIRGRTTCFDDLVVSIRGEIRCHETGKFLETCVVSGELRRLPVDLPCTPRLTRRKQGQKSGFLIPTPPLPALLYLPRNNGKFLRKTASRSKASKCDPKRPMPPWRAATFTTWRGWAQTQSLRLYGACRRRLFGSPRSNSYTPSLRGPSLNR